MPLVLPKKWRLLPEGPPGRRFRDRYYQHREQRQGRGRGWLSLILRFLLSALAAAVGFVLVFIPGPAILFFLISGALLASDWLPVARLLDWGEVRARRLGKWARRLWKNQSRPRRVALVTAAALASAAVTVGFYRLVS